MAASITAGCQRIAQQADKNLDAPHCDMVPDPSRKEIFSCEHGRDEDVSSKDNGVKVGQ